MVSIKNQDILSAAEMARDPACALVEQVISQANMRTPDTDELQRQHVHQPSHPVTVLPSTRPESYRH